MSNFTHINNVRVSFPHLFEKPIINGEEGKCGATLMLSPKDHAKTISLLKTEISELMKEKFKGKKIPSDKLCLRNGEDKGREEYEDYVVLSANSKDKPVVINSKGTGVITEPSESAIYAGCYVNAKVRLWAQDNKYGKRINCELVAIQFAADGESLDESHVSVDTAMEGFGSVTTNDPLDNDDDDFLNVA